MIAIEVRKGTLFFIFLLLSIWSLTYFASPSDAAEIVLDDYEDGLSEQWEEKSFKGSTSYTVTGEEGFPTVRAESRGAASALYFKIKYDLVKYPYLTWRWKVAGTIAKGDARTKEGDDYAARIHIVFPSVFWQAKAINYIWANKLPKGSVRTSSYTKDVVMVAVESGNGLAGQWVTETRNLLEDCRRFFGTEPPPVGGIAIMTDTDDTGESASAWYGPIRIHDDQSP